MSYEKQTWQKGDVITANKLNHIEDGIGAIEIDASRAEAAASDAEHSKDLAEAFAAQASSDQQRASEYAGQASQSKSEAMGAASSAQGSAAAAQGYQQGAAASASEVRGVAGTLNARMDTFTTLAEGSTTGDAELVDIRVGVDGTTYTNAGGAVRGQISQLKEDLNDVSQDIVTRAFFNGTSSECSIDPITLSSDGDFLEIEIVPEVDVDRTGYSFASNTNKSNVSIGATRKGFAVRAKDQTWLCLNNTVFANEPKESYILKIEYANSNIGFYIDGTLISTYTGQKTVEITGFGKNNYWDYWQGSIGYIRTRTFYHNNISLLDNYNPTNIAILKPYGFLTKSQYTQLEDASKRLIVEASATKVSVYTKFTDTIYGRIDIGYEIDHSDAQYKDYWRINDSAICQSTDGGESFTPTAQKLLIGAENEMAINFQGMGDHTGGYHGDERIDIDSGCYVTFIVNGQEFNISDLINLGKLQCDEFAYREKSILYASYQYNTNHLPIAHHTKITTFKGDCFETINYVGVDLTDLAVSDIRIITAYTGLFCIASAFANKAISDIGIEYTASHPTTTTILAENMNVYDREAKTYSNSYSCEMNSELISTNISDYKTAPIDVDIWDRQTDLKYYSFLPAVTVTTGDYLATKGCVKWRIN